MYSVFSPTLHDIGSFKAGKIMFTLISPQNLKKCLIYANHSTNYDWINKLIMALGNSRAVSFRIIIINTLNIITLIKSVRK